MKVAICLLLITFGIINIGSARTWTRSDGKTVEAEITYFTDKVAVLELSNGQEFTIPTLELSLEDQVFLKSWEPKRPIDVPEEAVFRMGRWYLRVLDKTPGSKAAGKAEAMGGHLVRIRDQEMNDFVFKLSDGLKIWVDGSDKEVEGLWEFSDGKQMEFKNWLKGQPDNYRRREHFLIIRMDGKWNDCWENDSSVVGYIVEWD